MKKLMIGVAGAAIVALGAYLFTVNGGKDETNAVTSSEIKQMVQDFSSGNSTARSASITSQELMVVHEDSTETTFSLPDDEFFVSIAPFENETHPCEIHSLTSCRGEMANEEFNIYIEDNDGNVVMNQAIKSQPNGFIDLWVPRDKELSIKISQDGKTAESEITTFEQDNTCITTMQLT
ncbi:CueP family metal-binding protein [Paenibacillus sp. GCM10028914]|uniref:CueP family metal-binding protein n=1 Tax=Paenibacillus sp. GCM10028914 TaxID=3273416 RepID=UPI0036115118